MLSYHHQSYLESLWVSSSKIFQNFHDCKEFVLDKACLVWGRTCNGNGNCWLYNGETLRYTMNFTAAAFVLIGTLFDAAVCYYVKGLQIFDEEIELEEDITTGIN